MRPHRRLMDPSTLEMLVLLRFNRDLWSDRDVDTIISRTQTAAPVVDDLPIPSPPLTVASTPISILSGTSSSSRFIDHSRR